MYERASNISEIFQVKSSGIVAKALGLRKKTHHEQQELYFPTIGIISEMSAKKYDKNELWLNYVDRMPQCVPASLTG
jgi:hypothetical protein